MLDQGSLDRIGRHLKSIYDDTAQAELPDHLQRLLAELERAERRQAGPDHAPPDGRDMHRQQASLQR